MGHEADLKRRALAAYFRNAAIFEDHSTNQPCAGTVIHNEKLYVTVNDSTGQRLAVYRVRNDGMLKRLRRPPRELP